MDGRTNTICSLRSPRILCALCTKERRCNSHHFGANSNIRSDDPPLCDNLIKTQVLVKALQDSSTKRKLKGGKEEANRVTHDGGS
jgi:hypothetical protein